MKGETPKSYPPNPSPSKVTGLRLSVFDEGLGLRVSDVEVTV